MASHSKAPPRSGGKRGSNGAELLARQRELYALPLSDFTRARDALAKELASKGQSKDAQAIRKLKRPVVTAWVVNQLAHQHPDHIEELLSAARDLEKAQRRAMSGLAAEPLKEANRAFQRALDALMKDVNDSLAATGRPPSGELIRQVDETLRTASLGSEEERTMLTQGMLTRPLRSSGGFGDFSALELVGPLPERAPRRPAKPPPSQRPAKSVEPSTPAGGKVLHGPWTPRVREEKAPARPPPPPKRPASPPRPSKRQLRDEARAETRREREVELRQLRRDARQQAAEAQRAERLSRQEVVRTKAVLRTAEAKSRYARGALEAAEARARRAREALETAEEQARQARETLAAAVEAERAQAEEVSRVEQQAQATEKALTQAQRHLKQVESRLPR
ncbi:hypothetical protein [Hyalangium gracile]|uniref:hypothetical protein n=1 Tax=Hyalangium gracile TaxID=394092 RepID=UPI001CCB39F5|nr:hypothetical protein [Hyalangium gracile]